VFSTCPIACSGYGYASQGGQLKSALPLGLWSTVSREVDRCYSLAVCRLVFVLSGVCVCLWGGRPLAGIGFRNTKTP